MQQGPSFVAAQPKCFRTGAPSCAGPGPPRLLLLHGNGPRPAPRLCLQQDADPGRNLSLRLLQIGADRSTSTLHLTLATQLFRYRSRACVSAEFRACPLQISPRPERDAGTSRPESPDRAAKLLDLRLSTVCTCLPAANVLTTG